MVVLLPVAEAEASVLSLDPEADEAVDRGCQLLKLFVLYPVMRAQQPLAAKLR